MIPIDLSARDNCDRRDFLLGASALTVSLASAPGALAEKPSEKGRARAAPSAGLILRQKEPENLEFPFATLDSFLVPNEHFYVRNHFATPKLEARTWRLKVEGAVKKPLALSLADLRKLPSRTVPALLECAGNNRAFLIPKAKGVGWESGAVGTAEWTGVSLATVLERAGLARAAVEVILEGADSGTITEEPKPPGVIHFARSLPLARAKKTEVLLAYRMNGKDLPVAHGFPVRAVVPGWYGVASVKWLTRLIVTERPFNGFFQSIDYSYFERRHGLPSVVPITELQVKAAIARPGLREVVSADRDYRIHGASWTGDAEVVKVEVSVDGGRTWTAARLLGKAVRHCWRLWDYTWHTPKKAGRAKVMARATDSRGRTQPLRRDPDRRNYLISHVLPIEVEVR